MNLGRDLEGAGEELGRGRSFFHEIAEAIGICLPVRFSPPSESASLLTRVLGGSLDLTDFVVDPPSAVKSGCGGVADIYTTRIELPPTGQQVVVALKRLRLKASDAKHDKVRRVQMIILHVVESILGSRKRD